MAMDGATSRLLGSLGYGPGLLDWALRAGPAGLTDSPLPWSAARRSGLDRVGGSRVAALSLNTADPARTTQTTVVGDSQAPLAADPAALGKDDFLRLLIMQIRYQDPTNPLDDRAFLAQMAQFSALEQTMQVANGLTQLSEQLQVAQERQFALSLLGRRVEVQLPDGQHQQGLVEGVEWSADGPQVVIDGKPYGINQVTRTLS